MKLNYHVTFWQFLHEIELSCNILTSLTWYWIIMYFDHFYMKLNDHVLLPFLHEIELSCYMKFNYHVIFWQFLHDIDLSFNILTILTWNWIMMYFDHFYMKLNQYVIFWPFLHYVELSCISTLFTWNCIIM